MKFDNKNSLLILWLEKKIDQSFKYWNHKKGMQMDFDSWIANPQFWHIYIDVYIKLHVFQLPDGVIKI